MKKLTIPIITKKLQPLKILFMLLIKKSISIYLRNNISIKKRKSTLRKNANNNTTLTKRTLMNFWERLLMQEKAKLAVIYHQRIRLLKRVTAINRSNNMNNMRDKLLNSSRIFKFNNNNTNQLHNKLLQFNSNNNQFKYIITQFSNQLPKYNNQFTLSNNNSNQLLSSQPCPWWCQEPLDSQ